MPATRNEATRRWKPPKVTPFAELFIGTAIRPSRERLRTLRTVAQRRAKTLKPFKTFNQTDRTLN